MFRRKSRPEGPADPTTTPYRHGRAPSRPTTATPPPPDESPAAPDASPAATNSPSLIGGIDLGGTKIAAAILGPAHNVVAYAKRPTPYKGGPEDVVREVVATMQEAAADAGVETSQLRGIGMGAPGSVDTDTGDLSGAGNLPNWKESYPLGRELAEALGTTVKVGNDVQVATSAEYELGAGVDHTSLLGVFWGTGVGGGIVLDGKQWKGRGRAGEIGHTLVRRGGARALNGLHGTVEAYAGRKSMEDKARREVKKGRETSLFKLMKKHDKKSLTSAIWAKALEEEDELATDLLNRAVVALSAGIASAVNLLDVEAVVIGGGLGVRFADTLVPEIIDGMAAYLLEPDNPPVTSVAALGDEGGVIGASLLVA
jgi:glucokinase